MKITNPDVYKLRLASMRACLDSIEHALDQDGGITKEPYDALGHSYDQLRALANHVVHGHPFVRLR